MKTLILFALLAATALARPTVTLVPADNLAAQLLEWRKEKALNWRYLTPAELKVLNSRVGVSQDLPADVVMWEPYTGQPIAPGDLFIADFPGGFKNAVRECKEITDANITTVYPTTIPLTEVRGVVRRIVRVTP